MSACAVITASSNLQELCIWACSIQSAGWVHAFPTGHQLPHLLSLDVCCGLACALASSDIASLASCCPAVEQLRINTVADASLGPFKVLTALTSLEIGPVKPVAVCSNLAALSQLQDLEVLVSLPARGSCRDATSGLQHLAPLTALEGLTWFFIDSPALGLRLLTSSAVSK